MNYCPASFRSPLSLSSFRLISRLFDELAPSNNPDLALVPLGCKASARAQGSRLSSSSGEPAGGPKDLPAVQQSGPARERRRQAAQETSAQDGV